MLHNVWLASTGELGYVFVNYTSKPTNFTVHLSDYDILKGPCKMIVHRPGKETVSHQDLALPANEAFQLAPREIMLIELVPAKGS